MIVVFWLEKSHMDADSYLEAKCKHFNPKALDEALKFAESLRAKRREYDAIHKAAGHTWGAPIISHVCLQSEMPESVGQAGVSDPSTDYSWSKRRIDPSIPLGRPKAGTEEITREE